MTRIERDQFGAREVPEAAYYGVQTLRAVENFAISGIPLARYGDLVVALAYMKQAAALANRELGVLAADKADAIAAACDDERQRGDRQPGVGDSGPPQGRLPVDAPEFADVIKIGRTQLQDAVPMTLGQEFAAYAVMVGESVQHLRRAGDELLAVNLGATAIGTGINTPPGYQELVVERLAETSRLPVRRAEDLLEATQDSGDFVQLSATMKRAAVQISKVCNDLRLLSSGPRAGLGEIRLPAV